MKVERLHVSVLEQAEQEYAKATANHVRAIADYNVMMGNLEDPSEEEEENEDE